MTRVRWADLEPGPYEDMVAVLICSVYPDAAERIDGSGGDGGRDVQLRYGTERDGFELKGFTGRLAGGRRTQVKRSLQRAASLGLRSWTLVVPIDPTPGELAWFEGLQQLIDCPIAWRGLTWLDARMAERPSIARYFIERLEGEVLAMLVRLKAEEAALTDGVPGAMTRVQSLVEQANELDPYYRFEFASDGTSTAASRSWYAGARVATPGAWPPRTRSPEGLPSRIPAASRLPFLETLTSAASRLPAFALEATSGLRLVAGV